MERILSRNRGNTFSSSVSSFNSEESLLLQDLERNQVPEEDQTVPERQEHKRRLRVPPTVDFLPSPVANMAINKLISFFYFIFINGPKHPSDQPYKCDYSQVLASLDTLPKRLWKTYPGKVRSVGLVLYILIWLGIAVPIMKHNLNGVPQVKDVKGNVLDFEVVQLSCREFGDVWPGKKCTKCLNAECCLSGIKENDAVSEKDIIIKCPALCDSESRLFSKMTAGPQSYKYVSYVVGGGLIENASYTKIDDLQITYPYRADSYPCAAALHAGLISAAHGGSARMSFASSNDFSIAKFPSAKGSKFSSIAFNSTFPYSFFFKEMDKDTRVTNAYDYRLVILALNVIFCAPLLFFAQGVVGYTAVCAAGFWTIVLAVDPPVTLDSLNPEATSRLLSVGFERLLPLGFVLFSLWKLGVRRTLSKEASPIGKTFVWYTFSLISMMNNLTFDRYMTIDRLLISDLKANLTSAGTLIAAATGLVSGVVVQAISVWKAGKFGGYICYYLITFIGCFLLNSLPGLTLRIHHYIFGMVLIPGTTTRGFSALLFQGLLLGFIINGVARWGFASIVETDDSLRRDDPYDRQDLRPPQFSGFDINEKSLSWSLESASAFQERDPVNPKLLNGFSLIVNDIERYRGKNETVYFDTLAEINQDFKKFLNDSLAAAPSIELYVRVAKASTTKGGKVGDYTNAGTIIWPEGDFVAPLPGVT